MTARLRVRMYNVLLGDAILVSVPDKENGKAKTRHILIDFGNKATDVGSDNAVFAPVIKDVLKELDGEPLDLYVMTHEHLDHNQGLLYTSAKESIDVKKKLAVRHVWLTASAAPDYYATHPDAEKEKKKSLAAYDEAKRYLAASPEKASPFLLTLMAINNPTRTGDCVEFLRNLAPKARTHYIHRGVKLAGKHPFEFAKFSVWAPEEDTSEYYGTFKPLFAGTGEGALATSAAETLPLPPPGVDAGAFYNLVDARLSGVADNLLAIDKAANNTSIVFCLEWKGWKLLFPGDAEERSWKQMNKQGVLEPVHFLKIGHHGSHNGTPGDDLLDQIMPLPPPDKKKRTAGMSTCHGAYSGMPDPKTLDDVKKRAKLYSTEKDIKKGKLSFDLFFG